MENNLVPSKSGKKTAKQLLKENPLKGKLAREIAEIEAKFQRDHSEIKHKGKQVTADMVIAELCKSDVVSSSFNGKHHIVKHHDIVICWVAERKKWVSVSTWGKGFKNFKTTQIFTKEQMKKAIKMIREANKIKKYTKQPTLNDYGLM